MEGLSLDLPLLLQTVHNILVAPANLMGEALLDAQVSQIRLSKTRK